MTRVSIITALIAAITLAGSVLSAWNGVREAASTVAQGDAQRVVALVQSRLEALDRRPSAAELDAMCAALAPEGVHFLGVRDRRGDVTSSRPRAGMATPLPGPGEMDSRGGLFRVASLFVPRHGPARGHPPPPPGGGSGDPPRPVAPTLVVEFESPTTASLVLRSRVTLGLGLGAAVLLVLASLVVARATRDQQKAVADVARARHLATLGEMSAVLAHEIRNPLASLKGHAQLLEESLAAESDAHGRAERIVREATRIERLTEDLLRFVRSATAVRSTVDLRAFVRGLDGQPPHVLFRLDDEDGMASVDAERLHSALSNLLQNARQAAPPESVELEVRTDARVLTLTVRDRGPGIEEGTEEQIFEPFHTTRTQGTGLGLAIARRVATAHGGSLVAQNRSGGGAEFVLRIPLEA